MPTTPEEYKLLGNKNYSNKEFDRAIECYSKAIQLEPSNQIYWSNRLAAHMESGNYTSALDDCKIAIGRDETTAIAKKLAIRMIHLICLTRRFDFVGSTLSNIGKMFATSGGGTTFVAEWAKLTSRQTPFFCTSGFPLYYPVGHDNAQSALRVDDERFVDWKKLSGEPLRVFYAGLGDGRHAFTIADFDKLLLSNPGCDLKLQFVLNDINPAAIAKFIVLLVQLQRLGRFETYNRKDPKFVFRLVGTTQIFGAVALHPLVQHDLMKTIRECCESINNLPVLKFASEECKQA
ncbi:hypothetical protein HK100_006678, partial [Physocladia obscura]